MNEELDRILIMHNDPSFDKKLKGLRKKLMLAARFEGYFGKGNRAVVKILRDVAVNGYAAVRKYTKRFDKVDIPQSQFRISDRELKKAHEALRKKKSLLLSIRRAIKNVHRYQERIFIGGKRSAGIRYTPLERVGIYVPGGSAPLYSTVVMTVVPAQVAGVKEIVVVSPPIYNRTIHPITLAVCCELGVREIYKVGGSQAVAVLASRKTIRKVDKIVGPGNRWVQTAKKMVSFSYTGIEGLAGPSEVLIIANDKANPVWVAADMLSQAEHAPGSAVVATNSQELGKKVLDEVKKQVKQLSRSKDTTECLIKYSKIAVFNNMDNAVEFANEFAAEHLEIQCGDQSSEIAKKIENAGAIFIGDYSPVAVGDYWAGPSHTLPTGTCARFSSGLTANDFIKSTSIIEYDKEKLAQCAEDIIRLAEAEGLDAHAKSIRIRGFGR